MFLFISGHAYYIHATLAVRFRLVLLTPAQCMHERECFAHIGAELLLIVTFDFVFVFSLSEKTIMRYFRFLEIETFLIGFFFDF